MPPHSQPLIRVYQWSGVAMGMLFLWQFIIAGWSVFVMFWVNIMDQCCEGRPPSLDRGKPIDVFLLIANLTVFITLITEVYLLVDHKLTVNLNLGIQTGKTSYVGAILIWRLVRYFQFCSGRRCVGDVWWPLLAQTATFELPFFLAFGYAIFAKVKSARGRIVRDEEIPSEERPLLAEDIGAPPAQPL